MCGVALHRRLESEARGSSSPRACLVQGGQEFSVPPCHLPYGLGPLPVTCPSRTELGPCRCQVYFAFCNSGSELPLRRYFQLLSRHCNQR